MTEFENQDLIRTLRSAGTDGPAFAMTPLHETTRRGRRARRRRAVVTGLGTTALVAGVVTGALAIPPTLQGPDALPPASPTDPTDAPTPDARDDAIEAISMTAGEMIAAHKAAVFDELPEGFVQLTEENSEPGEAFADIVAVDRPASDGLPDGVGGGISVGTMQGPDALSPDWCDARSENGGVTTACVDVEVDGRTVQVQHTSHPGSDSRSASEAVRTTYVNPHGDLVYVDLNAWQRSGAKAWDSDAARAWVDAMHEQIVSIVLRPSFQPTEWDERWRTEAVDLAADLGAQWQVLDEPPAASVHPSEALAASLPQDMHAAVWRDVIRNGDLAELCAARTEDGMQRTACETVPGTDVVVSYGVMADSSPVGEGTSYGRLADATVYAQQADGSIVLVTLAVMRWGTGESPDAAGVQSWLEEQVPDLARAAGSMS